MDTALVQLTQEYVQRGPEIQRRLREFEATYQRGDQAIFEELGFCILAANSSAEMAMQTVAATRDLLWDGTAVAIQQRLMDLQRRSGRGFRYWRRRPEYIVHTREYLREAWGLKLRAQLDAFPDPIARRDFFAQTPGVKGVGYKEASHFLRNIGFRGYAILDKHILSSLKEFGVTRSAASPKNRTSYLRIERKVQAFAETVGIGPDELDLLLWSRKTGKILK